MSKDFGSDTIEGISNAGPQQVNVNVDESDVISCYSAMPNVMATAEEFIFNFAGPLRPTGRGTAVMKVEQRVYASPWAAKRLLMQLQGTMAKYEEAFGPVELEQRARQTNAAAVPGKPN